jgi:hypothetical protein
VKKYITRGDLHLNSESFRDESVWEQLVEYANKEWEEEFNSEYIMNLLT